MALLFEQLFSEVYYRQIAEERENLEGIFHSLFANLQFDVSTIMSEDGKLDVNQIVKFAESIETGVMQKTESIARYWASYNKLRTYLYSAISNELRKLRIHEKPIDEVGSRILEMSSDLDNFFRYSAPFDSGYLATLASAHVILGELLDLAQMYSADSNHDERQWRHLYEQGYTRIGMPEEDYISMMRRHCEDIKNTYRPLSQFATYYFQIDYSQFLPSISVISWESNKSEADKLRNQLIQGFKYAELAYRKHLAKGNVVATLKPYTINYNMYGVKKLKGRFRLQDNTNGYIAYRGDRNPTIVVGFSGTEMASWKNWWTNIRQYLCILPAAYAQAAGIIQSIIRSKGHRKKFVDAKVEAYGHSLGGGLMQYAIGRVGNSDFKGFGYNSAGLSIRNAFACVQNTDNISHLYLPMDIIFQLPFSIQIGKSVRCTTFELNPKVAHGCDCIRKHCGKYKNDIAILKS